jgi:hypothetical protein
MVLGLAMVSIAKLFRSHAIPLVVVLSVIFPVIFQSSNLIGFGNVLASPAQDKHIYFEDSNLDWGQSWERIGHILERDYPGQPVYIRYYTSPLHYYAPNNPQAPLGELGAAGPGIILLSASDLNNVFSKYQRYVPSTIVDDAYFLYRTEHLVLR